MKQVKCSLFVCRYLSTCIVGMECKNGVGRKCLVNLCEVCTFAKKCKKQADNKTE